MLEVVDGLHLSRDLQCPQVNLVDWLKMMVGNRRSEEVVDPNIEVKPSTRALKRALLTALRCVDPDSEKRPKMGQVVSMLESEEYPLSREDRRQRRNPGVVQKLNPRRIILTQTGVRFSVLNQRMKGNNRHDQKNEISFEDQWDV